VKFDELELGMRAVSHNVVERADIAAFADLSGDHNPVHLDEDFARATQFKGCIAHGMLSATYISGLLGTELPGPGAIYVGQTLSFRAPVRPGDEVETEVKVKALAREKRKVTLETICRVAGKIVLEGEAVVLAAP
jgi:3-hydroxybutyryl-CoA dehydratase